MKSLYARGLAEIQALLAAHRALPASGFFSFPEVGTRQSLTSLSPGTHMIAPAICTREGDIYWCQPRLGSLGMMVLHKEQMDATTYPLSLTAGLFFSEALAPENDCADQYHQLVMRSLAIVGEALDGRGRLAYEDIDAVGRHLQQLDAEFARKKINRPQDKLHLCYGPNPAHPYSKIALCRTTLPVIVEGRVVPFFFEKFLIAYSYFDEYGKRRSTVTPMHSHPLNFETAYFTSYGPRSIATEQEFHLILDNDRPLIDAEGKLDPAFIQQSGSDHLCRLTLVPDAKYQIRAGAEPVMLPTFDSDRLLRKAGLIDITDGLFRPHQVSIHDDPEADRETLYYAVDNYLGPKGRVLLFSEDGRVNLWSHRDWR